MRLGQADEREIGDQCRSPRPLGYVSAGLTRHKRAYFFKVLDEYQTRKLPLGFPIKILGPWIVRFRMDYLSNQTFFESYPPARDGLSNAGKERYF